MFSYTLCYDIDYIDTSNVRTVVKCQAKQNLGNKVSKNTQTLQTQFQMAFWGGGTLLTSIPPCRAVNESPASPCGFMFSWGTCCVESAKLPSSRWESHTSMTTLGRKTQPSTLVMNPPHHPHPSNF